MKRLLYICVLIILYSCFFIPANMGQESGKNSESKQKKKKDSDLKQKDKKTKNVVVEGVGETKELALNDAFRNAVTQVVGVLIDSKAMVKNDKLIEDKILTLSNGFVKTHKIIPGSQVKSGRLYKVKIEAEVEIVGIKNILLKEKIMASGLIDGESLVKQVEGKEKIIKDASEMIEKK